MTASWVGQGAGSDTLALWPAGHLSGDLGILFVEIQAGALTDPGAEWFQAIAVANAVGTTTLEIWIAEAINGAMPGASLAGGTDHRTGFIGAVRDAHMPTLLEAIRNYATAWATAASVSGFAPGVYCPIDDCLVIHAIAWAIDDASDIASGWANSSLTGVTERQSAGTTSGSGGGISVATGVKATVGEIKAGTCTLTSTTFACATLVIPTAPSTPFSSGLKDVDDESGNPAPDGGVVKIFDTVLGVIETTAVIASGKYTAAVRFNTANRYISIYDNGVDTPGCSAPWTAS